MAHLCKAPPCACAPAPVEAHPHVPEPSPTPTCVPLWPFDDEAMAHGQRAFLLPSTRLLATRRGVSDSMFPPWWGHLLVHPFPISSVRQSSQMTLSQVCSSVTLFDRVWVLPSLPCACKTFVGL